MTYKATETRSVARLIEDKGDRLSPGGIALPESAKSTHVLVVEITDSLIEGAIGKKALIGSSTHNDGRGWFFLTSDSILAFVED